MGPLNTGHRRALSVTLPINNLPHLLVADFVLICVLQLLELWGRGNRNQSRLQRREWTNLTLSSAVLSVAMALASNAACKLIPLAFLCPSYFSGYPSGRLRCSLIICASF